MAHFSVSALKTACFLQFNLISDTKHDVGINHPIPYAIALQVLLFVLSARS